MEAGNGFFARQPGVQVMSRSGDRQEKKLRKLQE
jgi:hypothetical protein